MFASDLAFIEHVGVALASMAASASDPADVRAWVVVRADLVRHPSVDASVRAGRPLDVRVLPIEPDRVSGVPLSRHITEASYYRLHLPAILPGEIRRYLYLDADVLVESDLGPLAARSPTDHPVAAVADGYLRRRRLPGMGPASVYFNAGVLLVERDAWRASEVTERCTRVIAEHPDVLSYHDQDALNIVLDGAWAALDPRWNQQSVFWERSASRLGLERATLTAALDDPGIVHFSGARKPWQYDCAHPLRRRYEHARRRAGFPDAGRRPGSLREVGTTMLRRLLSFRHRQVLHAAWRSRRRVDP